MTLSFSAWVIHIQENCYAKEELLKITDLYTDDLFSFPGSPAIQSPVFRLLCNVERFTDEEQEAMAAKEMGAIYRNIVSAIQ